VRLFVALEIPTEVRENLTTFLQELKATATRAADKGPRWVRPENLHVTLKFIGEVAPAKLDGIRYALLKVRSEKEIRAAFNGVGFFPSEKRPKVFWVGLDASENLDSLARNVDEALAAQGVERETRPFSAHLTLARFEPPGLSDSLRELIQRNGARDFGSLQTREFHLFESKTKSSGAEYTRLAAFPFARESSH
jgi:RNA 2',3'-cyclic 3'-phosphodiesterase